MQQSADEQGAAAITAQPRSVLHLRSSLRLVIENGGTALVQTPAALPPASLRARWRRWLSWADSPDPAEGEGEGGAAAGPSA